MLTSRVRSCRAGSHEGELLGPLAVRSGWGRVAAKEGDEEVEEGSLLGGGPSLAADAVVAREDVAELVVQCALRLARDETEGAPPLRVVRIAPATPEGGKRKERMRQSYDTVIGGAPPP